ncbi:MAG TPA: phosphatidylglycerol lysyltransferase domain-containing protein [Clostridia bacterium]|nr:phosphatidylglycerol lysyltransferase domain-containing protein [Clostridia bacterium]
MFFISSLVSTLVFTPLKIEDKEWMAPLLRKGHRGALEYNFTSNFIWREVYKLQAARFEDRLVVMSNADNPSFIFPSGEGPVEPVVRAIDEYVSARGQQLVFNTLLNEDWAKLEAAFPGKFLIEPDRNDFDYVYDAQRLITLSGKKLASKRNHINKFLMDNSNWSYEPITKENIGDVHKMSLEWCLMAGCRENEDLFDESCAVEQAFKHFFSLGLTGGLLRLDGRVIAFAMGEELNEETYVVHVEKAFHEINGAYQMINQQFAMANCEGYKYINREDDAGDEGLRRAKLSYDPALLVEKSSATLIAPL